MYVYVVAIRFRSVDLLVQLFYRNLLKVQGRMPLAQVLGRKVDSKSSIRSTFIFIDN